VLQVLRTVGRPLAINELLHELKRLGSIPQLDQDEQLALFKLNWLMMNALYQLQQELLVEGFYLNISILHIELQAFAPSAQHENSHSIKIDSLRAYYLDWRQFSDTTKEEVQALLDGVVFRCSNAESIVQARKLLGVGIDASADDIKKQYRKKIHGCHPDKGGDAQAFMNIRQAYELLRQS